MPSPPPRLEEIDILSRRTNQTQEAWVCSRGGPIGRLAALRVDAFRHVLSRARSRARLGHCGKSTVKDLIKPPDSLYYMNRQRYVNR
eukprot:4984372-Pyramimonas_sp.AAC.1